METKDKRLYERPVMTVVILQHQSRLLQGSPEGDLGNPNKPIHEYWD